MTPASGEPHAHFAELAVGYAMHALEPEDDATFTAHLRGCAECATAVEQWRTTAGHLAYGAGTEAPSSDLRARLLATIGHDESVVRPLNVDVRDASNVRTLTSRSRRPMRSTSRFTHALPVRALATAAALTGVIGAGALVTSARQDASQARQELSLRTAAMESLLHNGAKYFSMGARGAASGFAIVDGSDLFLSVDGLPRNDTKASTYVLWSKGKSGALDAVSTFDVTGHEPVLIKLVTSKAATTAASFAVSYEPGRSAPKAPSRVTLG